jgi:RimJ/RimL family protein N-acetyltransferase
MITGNRVSLRAVEYDDLEQLKKWRNIQTFRKNFREIRELNQENQNNWYSKLNSAQNDFMFIIVRNADTKPIGACGLLYINWIIRSADFSFYIGENELYIDNDGYAEDAVNLLLNYGFDNLNLNKIWMELYEFDTLKLDLFLNKFNFKIDGKLRSNCYEEGRYFDSMIISLLKSDKI